MAFSFLLPGTQEADNVTSSALEVTGWSTGTERALTSADPYLRVGSSQRRTLMPLSIFRNLQNDLACLGKVLFWLRYSGRMNL